MTKKKSLTSAQPSPTTRLTPEQYHISSTQNKKLNNSCACDMPASDRNKISKISLAQHILKQKGTEAPFTGKFLHNKKTGTYICADCKTELFTSNTKFDSGTGWPSFSDVKNKHNIELKPDNNYSMNRTEVLCKKCHGHLGHLFDDGPTPTEQRYCINSAALNFKEKEETKK